MERTTPCESGELATREIEPHTEAKASPAKATSILLSPVAPTMPLPSVEVIAPVRPTPSVRPRISKRVRLLDLALAVAMLLFVLPLMVFCALAIKLSSPGPVIYRHFRIGLSGREFTCYKFRTMVDGADQSINSILAGSIDNREEWSSWHKLRHDPRVTSLGRFMRRHSIDELPQLFNVLKGEMSIVGPRPIVADEIHKYGDHFADYCAVNPGLTGLWQVSGRHALSYDQRVSLDAEYAKAKSLRLDLLILWRTVPVVLFGQNE